jgi:hypothetical protein
MVLKNSEDGNGFVVDTEVKLKQVQKENELEVKLTPSKIKVENKFKPSQINDENTKGSLLGRLDHKVGSDKPDLTAGFTYALPKAHEDAGAFFEGNVTYKGLKDWTGDISGLLSYKNQFFLGSQINGDLQTRKADKITGIFAAKLDDNFVYLHANCLEHVIRVGFSTQKIEHIGTFAAETEIKLREEGPIQDRTTGKIAFNHKLNDDTTLKIKLDVTKQVYVHMAFSHRINKNLMVTIMDHANPLGFFKNSAKENYRLGVALEGSF